MKKGTQIEYVVKGFSNRNRIRIIMLLNESPELTVTEIASKLNLSFNNASAHLMKMMATGIVMKRSSGLDVKHALTCRGKNIYFFISKI